MDIDRDYYLRRLHEELRRADMADSTVAKLAHRKLAEYYRQRLTHPEPTRYRRGLPDNNVA